MPERRGWNARAGINRNSRYGRAFAALHYADDPRQFGIGFYRFKRRRTDCGGPTHLVSAHDFYVLAENGPPPLCFQSPPGNDCVDNHFLVFWVDDD
jgi:hypothetical protein